MNDELDHSYEVDWHSRSSGEIRRRSLVLFGLVRMARGEDGRGIYRWLVNQNIESAISPEEKRILTSKQLTDRDRINASWRVEGLEVMLWALNELPDLSPLSGQCDSSRIEDVLSPILSNTSDFLDRDSMRSEGEICEQQVWPKRAAQAIFDRHS